MWCLSEEPQTMCECQRAAVMLACAWMSSNTMADHPFNIRSNQGRITQKVINGIQYYSKCPHN